MAIQGRNNVYAEVSTRGNVVRRFEITELNDSERCEAFDRLNEEYEGKGDFYITSTECFDILETIGPIHEVSVPLKSFGISLEAHNSGWRGGYAEAKHKYNHKIPPEFIKELEGDLKEVDLDKLIEEYRELIEEYRDNGDDMVDFGCDRFDYGLIVKLLQALKESRGLMPKEGE